MKSTRPGAGGVLGDHPGGSHGRSLLFPAGGALQTKVPGGERVWPVGETGDLWVQLRLVHSRKPGEVRGQSTQ